MNALLLILLIGSVPHNLSTDLLTDTRSVFKGGYHTSATLSQVQESWRRGQTDYFQVSTINSEHPYLAWELPEGLSDQKAYRILMASKTELLSEGKADVWDSGDVEDSQTTGIVCSGKALPAMPAHSSFSQPANSTHRFPVPHSARQGRSQSLLTNGATGCGWLTLARQHTDNWN